MACSAASNNYHCQNDKRGRVISWTKDFIQYGIKVYFKKHIEASEYEYKKPFSAQFYGKVYQEELDGKNQSAYSIQQTNKQITIQYYWPGWFISYQLPSGEFQSTRELRDKAWDKLINGEIEYLIEYALRTYWVEKVIFDIPQKILTEYWTYPFPLEGTGKKAKKIYLNGNIYGTQLGEITPTEKQQITHDILGTERVIGKYNCKEDDSSFFRHIGNKLFWILGH